MTIFIIATVIMSVITFSVYGYDKYLAKRHLWRIPESTLLLLTFFGGSFGALLGMFFFNHKTRKLKFKIFVPLFLLIWIGLAVVIMMKIL